MTDLTRPIIGIENRTAQEVFDIMCDRIRHAPLLPREGVVEELKWRTGYCDDQVTIHQASFGGLYQVRILDGVIWVDWPDHREAIKVQSIEDGKAAAQADYERIILSALRSGGDNG